MMLLRQYGVREYAVVLMVAAVVGLGLAVLLNTAAGGGADAPTELTLKPKETAAASTARPSAVQLYKPARKAAPVSPAKKVRKQRARPRPAPTPAPKPAPAPASEELVATRTPAPQPTYTPPAPAPRPAPAASQPAPAPKPAPASKPGGGGQFDDSG
jgi:hypothetical protein